MLKYTWLSDDRMFSSSSTVLFSFNWPSNNSRCWTNLLKSEKPNQKNNTKLGNCEGNECDTSSPTRKFQFVHLVPQERKYCFFQLILPFCNVLNRSTSDWILLSVSLFSESILEAFAWIFVLNSFQFMRNAKWFVLVFRNLKIRLKNTSHLLWTSSAALCVCVRQILWQQRNLM